MRDWFDGWHLIGQYDSDVGSWLLHNAGEAVLLEVPEGLTVDDVGKTLRELDVSLRYVVASHEHEDHLEETTWHLLQETFSAEYVLPRLVEGDLLLDVGCEPLWLVKAPKHSPHDVVTVFRGVAMTGDIELSTLRSVTGEVSEQVRRKSMGWLAGFEARHDYKVHSIVSAHLDDVRTNVDWTTLFEVP